MPAVTARKRRKQTTYGDATKAAAVAAYHANGDNLRRTAAETGIPRKTIDTWVKAQSSPAKVASVASFQTEASATLSEKLTSIAHRMASLVLEKPDDEISARDAMVSLGIAVDKKLVLEGKSPGVAQPHPMLVCLTTGQLHALLRGDDPRAVTVDAPALPEREFDTAAYMPPLTPPGDATPALTAG